MYDSARATDVLDRARQLADAFETATRSSGTTFVRLRDGSPQWMTDVICAAHDDGRILPDDHIYAYVAEFVEHLSNVDPQRFEDIDDLGDVAQTWADESAAFTYFDLAEWLGSHGERWGYCDEVLDEWTTTSDRSTSDLLRCAQIRERTDVAARIVDALHERALAA